MFTIKVAIFPGFRGNWESVSSSFQLRKFPYSFSVLKQIKKIPQHNHCVNKVSTVFYRVLTELSFSVFYCKIVKISALKKNVTFIFREVTDIDLEV